MSYHSFFNLYLNEADNPTHGGGSVISWGVELNSSTAVSKVMLKWAVGGRDGRKGQLHPGSCRVPLHLGGKPREEGIPAGLELKGQWRRLTSLGHDRKPGPQQRCLEKAD